MQRTFALFMFLSSKPLSFIPLQFQGGSIGFFHNKIKKLRQLKPWKGKQIQKPAKTIKSWKLY